MKKNCLLVLVVWLLAGAANAWLLRESSAASEWWVPVGLGFGTAVIYANLTSLCLAFKQWRASSRSPNEWSDGQLVGVSGRIQPLRTPLEGPFSGKRIVLAEYEVKRSTTGDEGGAAIPFMGFVMTPCSVSTTRGPVRIVGFPLLVNFPSTKLDLTKAIPRAARFLRSCQFKEKPKNPLTVLKEISMVLSDEDGEVAAHFSDSKYAASILTPSDSVEFDEVETTEDESASIPEPVRASVEEIADKLSAQFSLDEKSIESGAEVAVFGTYLQAKKAIDVGSGMSNLSHQIQLGSIGALVAKNFRSALLALLFWGALTGYGYYQVWGEAGLLTKLQALL